MLNCWRLTDKKLWIVENFIHYSSITFSTSQKPISIWRHSVFLFFAGHSWLSVRLRQWNLIWWLNVVDKSHWDHFWPTNQLMTFETKNCCWQDGSPLNKKFAIRHFEMFSQSFFKRSNNNSQPALEITIASKLQKTPIEWTVSKNFITIKKNLKIKFWKNICLSIWPLLADVDPRFSMNSPRRGFSGKTQPFFGIFEGT